MPAYAEVAEDSAAHERELEPDPARRGEREDEIARHRLLVDRLLLAGVRLIRRQLDRRVRREAGEADGAADVRSNRAERHRELRPGAGHEHPARRLRLELEAIEAVVDDEGLGLAGQAHPAKCGLETEEPARVEAERAHAVEAEAAVDGVGERSERLAVEAGDADGVARLALRGER